MQFTIKQLADGYSNKQTASFFRVVLFFSFKGQAYSRSTKYRFKEKLKAIAWANRSVKSWQAKCAVVSEYAINGDCLDSFEVQPRTLYVPDPFGV